MCMYVQGPCLEFLLRHRILETLYTPCKNDVSVPKHIKLTIYTCSIPVPVSTPLCMDSKVEKFPLPLLFNSLLSFIVCVCQWGTLCVVSTCVGHTTTTQCAIWQCWSLLYCDLSRYLCLQYIFTTPVSSRTAWTLHFEPGTSAAPCHWRLLH